MEMSNNEIKQLIDTIEEVGLESAAEAWGMSIDEIVDIYPVDEYLTDTNQFPYPEEVIDSEGAVDEQIQNNVNFNEGDTAMTAADYQQQFVATDEDVADMSWMDLISKGSDVTGDFLSSKLESLGIPPEYALLAAGVLTKSPKKVAKGTKQVFKSGKGTKGMFKSGKGSKVQVNPKEKFTNSKGSKHIVKRKKFGNGNKGKVNKGASNLRKNELTTAAGLTTGLALNRMLQGDRDVDGTLKVAPKPVIAAPKVETQGNQFGYHKEPGQNFWDADLTDPYWDTHEVEGSSAFEEAPLKKAPAKELDWSSWFK